MVFSFADESIREVVTSADIAIEKLGPELASNLRRTIADLRATECLGLWPYDDLIIRDSVALIPLGGGLFIHAEFYGMSKDGIWKQAERLKILSIEANESARA